MYSADDVSSYEYESMRAFELVIATEGSISWVCYGGTRGVAATTVPELTSTFTSTEQSLKHPEGDAKPNRSRESISNRVCEV